MRIHKIPLDKVDKSRNPKPKPYNGESEIDEWCMDHDLVRNKDYRLCYMSGAKEYHVTFNEEHLSMGSLLLLRWM